MSFVIMAHLFRGRGQPLLGNHVAFRSWHAYLHACLFGVALFGVLLTRPTLQGQGLQLVALPFSVPDAFSNSVVRVAPELGREEYPPLLFRPTLIIHKVNEALAM